jgi:hypothetical protein
VSEEEDDELERNGKEREQEKQNILNVIWYSTERQKRERGWGGVGWRWGGRIRVKKFGIVWEIALCKLGSVLRVIHLHSYQRQPSVSLSSYWFRQFFSPLALHINNKTSQRKLRRGVAVKNIEPTSIFNGLPSHKSYTFNRITFDTGHTAGLRHICNQNMRFCSTKIMYFSKNYKLFRWLSSL